LKAHLFLADSAQSEQSGKLHALGLGWTTTVTPTPPAAVVALVEVEWTESNHPFHIKLELLSADGELVMLPGPLGMNAMQIEGDLETGRPAGLPHGTSQFVPLTINLAGGMPLQVGQRYQWRLTIGESLIETIGFYVHAELPQTPA
jgi:hypothetical protein